MVKNTEAAVQEIARNFQAVKEMYIISRGLNYATSYEISLKLKELVYIMAQPYSAADVRHGPIALVEEGFPCLAIAPIGKALLDMADLIATLKTRGARVAIISNDRNVLSQSSLAVRLPVELPEWLSPIIGVIPGQLLAFHMARLRGYDLDHPRGLRKITITV